jgi:hypothetical protein
MSILSRQSQVVSQGIPLNGEDYYATICLEALSETTKMEVKLSSFQSEN